MVAIGEQAPDFTAPLANGSIDSVTLAEEWQESPVVLVFFPGVFTSVCRAELDRFQSRLSEIGGATLYGISIDTPFAQNAFRDDVGLDFGLISDTHREIVDAYDVSMDFEALGVTDVAKRSVFVIDETGTVRYEWVTDDPGVEPDYDAVIEAVQSL